MYADYISMKKEFKDSNKSKDMAPSAEIGKTPPSPSGEKGGGYLEMKWRGPQPLLRLKVFCITLASGILPRGLVSLSWVCSRSSLQGFPSSFHSPKPRKLPLPQRSCVPAHSTPRTASWSPGCFQGTVPTLDWELHQGRRATWLVHSCLPEPAPSLSERPCSLKTGVIKCEGEGRGR